MESIGIISFLHESIYTVVVFAVFLMYAMAKGRYAIINAIFALYLALLISIKFPYFNQIGKSDGSMKIFLFIVIVIAGIALFRRHIPGDDYETAFQGLWKKILLSAMASILVMAYSFHALPVTDIITPSTPIQGLFAPEEHFFWWLILPLIVLFFV